MKDRYKIISRRDETGKITHTLLSGSFIDKI